MTADDEAQKEAGLVIEMQGVEPHGGDCIVIYRDEDGRLVIDGGMKLNTETERRRWRDRAWRWFRKVMGDAP